jgi:RHS repeat-associated protein
VYDDYNRLESKTFVQNGISETLTYTYDVLGRVSEINQNGRITKTTYNSQGQTILIETPEGTITYTYDKYGNQATVQADNDPPTYYTYDRYGHLATVSSDNKTTYYEYDIWGNLAKTKLPNDVITTYQYDNMNRLVKLSNFVDKNDNGIFDNGEGISEFSYLLDNFGRKDYAFEKFWTEYGEQENEIDWEYDDAGRLIYEKFDHYDDEFDQTSEWIYDLVGNRLKQTVNGAITTYNFDVNDRLLQEIFNNKITDYQYDHTQQTSKKISENGILVSETTFEYDAQGRMSIVTIISGNRTEIMKYEYGTDGIRVSAEQEIYVDGELTKRTKTEYLNDPLNITGYSQVLKQTETDIISNEETVTTYVIGHQRISQIVVKNGTEQEYYFTFDGHGSTRVLMDFAGTIVQLYSFDAYGNALGFDVSQALTEFLYSGEQFDSKIGQQYLRARYYDPATGRFNRLDPFFGILNEPQSFHKYSYTHADPVNEIDPSGEIWAAITGIFRLLLQGLYNVPFVLTALNVANEAVNHGYKLISTGNGGKNATTILQKLRSDVLTTWNGMTVSERKKLIYDLFWSGLTSWDIMEFIYSDKLKWTEGIADPLEETLTYYNEVYAVSEVNYLLWGMINKLAWDDNIYTVATNYMSASLFAFFYRAAFGGLWIGQAWYNTGVDIYNYMFHGNTTISVPSLYDTTTGRMAWIYYGWQWVDNPCPPLPSHESIWRATPTSTPWTDGLTWHIAGKTQKVQ